MIYVGDDPRDMLASANAFWWKFFRKKKELKNGNDRHILNINSSFLEKYKYYKKVL